MASCTDRYGDLTQYVYYAVRNSVSETDPSGHLTQYAYFANGALERVIDGAGNITRVTGTVLGHVAQYAYDSEGPLIGITHPSGRVVETPRSAGGRINAVTTTAGGAPQTLASNLLYACALRSAAELHLRQQPHPQRRLRRGRITDRVAGGG